MNVKEGEEDKKKNIDFTGFISGLAAEGFIYMGLVENPMTKKTVKDLKSASMLIDTISVIEEKTEGNLSDEEKRFLEQTLYQLRMMYVSVSGGESPSGTAVEKNGAPDEKDTDEG